MIDKSLIDKCRKQFRGAANQVLNKEIKSLGADHKKAGKGIASNVEELPGWASAIYLAGYEGR